MKSIYNYMLKQAMSLGYIGFQLFRSYNFWYT